MTVPLCPNSTYCGYFKHLMHHFLTPLYIKILPSGTAPLAWSSSNIKLVFKAGLLFDHSNFCMVALSFFICKTLTYLCFSLPIFPPSNKLIDSKAFSNGMGSCSEVCSVSKLSKKTFFGHTHTHTHAHTDKIT